MDPVTGDLLVPASQHPYAYAHNNPVLNIDPTGLVKYRGEEGGGATSVTDIVNSVPGQDYALAYPLVIKWLETHPDYSLFADPKVWRIDSATGQLVPALWYHTALMMDYASVRGCQAAGEQFKAMVQLFAVGSLVRVGRWMGGGELNKMYESGMV